MKDRDRFPMKKNTVSCLMGINSTKRETLGVFLLTILTCFFVGAGFSYGGSEWTWAFVGAPLGDESTLEIVVDPANRRNLYVSTSNGVYVSKDEGETWIHSLSGGSAGVYSSIQMDPVEHDIFYATNLEYSQGSYYSSLHRSVDGGLSWSHIKDFGMTVRSMLVSEVDPTVIFLAPQNLDPDPPGVFKCHNRGEDCTYVVYPDHVHPRLLPWAIAQDRSPTESYGFLYVCTEKYDAERHYPPILRSTDHGETWETVGSFLSWHCSDVKVDQTNGDVFFLLEGKGLWKSSNHGDHHVYVKYTTGLGLSLLIHHDETTKPIIGHNKIWPKLHNQKGGVFFLPGINGYSPQAKGLDDKTVSNLGTTGTGHILYAAVLGYGIWRTFMDYCPPGVTDDGPYDLDGDGLGDACDPDIDGDGIRNEYDCNPYNPFVGADRDNDGVCDEYMDVGTEGDENYKPGNYENCVAHCEYTQYYYGSDFNLSWCKETCNVDNCITQYYNDDVYDKLCSHIDLCIKVGATLNEESCSPNGPDNYPYCTFIPGEGGQPNQCRPYRKACADAFANPDQEDSSGNGIGDQCDREVAGRLNFYPSLSSAYGWFGGYCTSYGDQQHILDFYTIGGEMTAVDPYGERPSLMTSNVNRDGVKAGACYCKDHKGDGSWEDDCTTFEEGKCRKDLDEHPISRRFIWSPINSPALAELINSDPDDMRYPVSTNHPVEPHPPHYDAVHEHSLFLYRGGFTFMRERSANNFHQFDWEWPESLDYNPLNDSWDKNAGEYTVDGRSVSIRVAWPPFSQQEDPITEVAISKNQIIGQSQKCSGVGPYLITKEQIIVASMPSIENYWFDPRGPWLPDYFLSIDPLTNAGYLFGLSAGTPEVSRIWAADFSEFVAADVRIAGIAGQMDEPLLGMGHGNTVLFFYQEPIVNGSGELDVQPMLFMGVPDDVDDGVIFMTDGDLFGTITPYIPDAQLTYLPGTNGVLAFGTRFSLDSNGDPVTHPGYGEIAQPEVWRFSLLDGSWDGPYPLYSLTGITGQTMIYERPANRVLIFGGENAAGQSLPTVFSLDPMTLALREITPAEPPPMNVERSQAGVFLDRTNRNLVVYGGKRDNEWLGDGWSYNLTSRKWTLLTGAAAAPQPIETPRPYVHYDTGRATLWTGALLGAKPAEGLPVFGYNQTAAAWLETRAVQLPGHIEWPVEDRYTAGKTHSYTYQTPEETPWPGQPMLGALTGPESLDVKVYTLSGEMIGRSEPIGTESRAAFICPPEAGCAARVGTLPGESPPYGEEFTLNMQPAVPTLENMVSPGGKLNDMQIRGHEIYIAGMQGLRITAADPSLGMHSEVRGPGYTAMTGISLSGNKAFVSRLGLHGLVVFDVRTPASPLELGRTFTFGASWDVAAYGDRVYVAHGILGIGVYDVSDPQNPVWIRQIWPGGRIETVSIHRGLLGAGRKNGRVYLYDIRGGEHEPVGEVNAGWALDRVEFKDGRLWVLRNNGNAAAVFEQNPEREWVKVGEVTNEAIRHLFGRTSGARGYTIGRNTVEAYMFEPAN